MVVKTAALNSSATFEVSVQKESVNSKLGLGLSEKNGAVIISSIKQDGLFANTNLQPGQRLVSIGDTSVRGLTKRDSIKLLKETSGSVKLVAEEVAFLTVTAVKPSKGSSIGLGLTMKDDRVTVGTIKETSIFKDTQLKVGQKIVSVNDVPCTYADKAEVVVLFKNAEGPVTVVVESGDAVPATPQRSEPMGFESMERASSVTVLLPGQIAVKAMKESKQSPVGIGVKMIQGHVTVGSIKETSIFHNTDLSPGQSIVSINGVSCSGLDKKEVAVLLKSAVGPLTVVVEEVEEVMAAIQPTSVAPMARGIESEEQVSFIARQEPPPMELKLGQIAVKGVKSFKDSSVGIGIKSANGRIIVGTVKATSIFYNTDLHAGHEIISINQIPVTGIDKKEVAGLLKGAEGIVTMVVEQIDAESVLESSILETSMVMSPKKEKEVFLKAAPVNNGSMPEAYAFEAKIKALMEEVNYDVNGNRLPPGIGCTLEI